MLRAAQIAMLMILIHRDEFICFGFKSTKVISPSLRLWQRRRMSPRTSTIQSSLSSWSSSPSTTPTTLFYYQQDKEHQRLQSRARRRRLNRPLSSILPLQPQMLQQTMMTCRSSTSSILLASSSSSSSSSGGVDQDEEQDQQVDERTTATSANNDLLLSIRQTRQLQQYGILFGLGLVTVSSILLCVINHMVDFMTLLVSIPITVVVGILFGTILLIKNSNLRIQSVGAESGGGGGVVVDGNVRRQQQDNAIARKNTFETILLVDGINNRLHQQSRQQPIDDSCFEIKTSNIPNAGLGLFALHDIPDGTYMMNYEGEMLTEAQYFSNDKYPNGDSKYVAEIPCVGVNTVVGVNGLVEFLLYTFWFTMINLVNDGSQDTYNEPIYIDAINPMKSNLARYMNSLPLHVEDKEDGGNNIARNRSSSNYHAAEATGAANVIWKKQRVIHVKFNNVSRDNYNGKIQEESPVVTVSIDGYMRFYTCQDIQKGDELCYDYGSQYWDAYNDQQE